MWQLLDSVPQIAQVPVLSLLVVPLDSAKLSLGAGLSACCTAVMRLVTVLELLLDLEPLHVRAAAGAGHTLSCLRTWLSRRDRLLRDLSGGWVLSAADSHLSRAIVVQELLPFRELGQVVHVAVRHEFVEGIGESALFSLKSRDGLFDLTQPYLPACLLGDALKRLHLVLGVFRYDSGRDKRLSAAPEKENRQNKRDELKQWRLHDHHPLAVSNRHLFFRVLVYHKPRGESTVRDLEQPAHNWYNRPQPEPVFVRFRGWSSSAGRAPHS